MLAVDATELSILQMDVFPESTWPSTPMLILMHLLGSMLAIYYLPMSRVSFYIYIY